MFDSLYKFLLCMNVVRFNLIQVFLTILYFRDAMLGPNIPSEIAMHLTVIVEKTQLCSAKRWQCITILINKSDTTVMVSCLIPHRSTNIYCVRISVRLPSILQRVRIPVCLPLIILPCFHSRPSSVDSSYNPFTYEFPSA